MNWLGFCILSCGLLFCSNISAEESAQSDLKRDFVEAYTYIEKNIMKALSVWDKKSICESFDPRILGSFESEDPQKDFCEMMTKMEEFMGSIENLSHPERLHFSSGELHGKYTTACHTVIMGDCEHGEVKISLCLVKSDGAWRLSMLKVQAQISS